MPVTLENGLVIYNVTPHVLNIWDHKARKVVYAPSDGIINGVPLNKEVIAEELYSLTNTTFLPNDGGQASNHALQGAVP